MSDNKIGNGPELGNETLEKQVGYDGAKSAGQRNKLYETLQDIRKKCQ
jgi:hypothetical protein